MATTSPDNIWTPDSGDDYALTVDLAATADTVQAAITNLRASGQYRVLTNAQRLALSGGSLFEGLRVWTSDTKQEWLYTNGAWVVSDSGWVAITLNGWTNEGGSYQNAEARKIDKTVYVEGLIRNGNPNIGQTIGTLPVGMRPKAYIIRTVWANGAARPVEIAPNGNIIVGDTAVSNLRTALGFSFTVG